jgi:hypothetical protein
MQWRGGCASGIEVLFGRLNRPTYADVRGVLEAIGNLVRLCGERYYNEHPERLKARKEQEPRKTGRVRRPTAKGKK